METVLLGSTGIKVSRLGIGLAEIGQTPESPPRLIEAVSYTHLTLPTKA